MVHKKKSLFNCQQCGTCCRWEGHVLLTEEDITRLSLVIGLSEEAFIECYTVLATHRRELSLAENSDGSCVFLEGNGCRHYADRPAQCRAFPVGWHDTSGCPAMESISRVVTPFGHDRASASRRMEKWGDESMHRRIHLAAADDG